MCRGKAVENRPCACAPALTWEIPDEALGPAWYNAAFLGVNKGVEDISFFLLFSLSLPLK